MLTTLFGDKVPTLLEAFNEVTKKQVEIDKNMEIVLQDERRWVVKQYQESLETFYKYGHNLTNLRFWIDSFTATYTNEV
jgi:hypothetical protein